jgi:hypothetical protein
VTHKILLRRILAGIIIAIAGVFWIYSLIGFIDWAFVSGPKERANLNTTLQVKLAPGVLASIAAINISFTEAEVASAGIGRYDFLAQVTNPNLARWWAEFDYRFLGEGMDGGGKKGFVLPGETKYIVDLGVESAFRPRNVRLEIANLKYHRVPPHQISDYAKWYGEHFNMAISNKIFNPKSVQNGGNISSLKFTATNNTAYGYKSMGFYGLLYRGEQLVSINYLAAENFTSGEARELEMQFGEGLPTITKYDVVPEFNVFDESGYVEMK